jgi:hypothetical protein
VLHYFVLQSLFEERPIRILDFTEGEGQHKAFFASDHRLCAKTYFLRRNLFNLMLIRVHCGLNHLVERIGTALDRMGLKTKIKRWIRRVA